MLNTNFAEMTTMQLVATALRFGHLLNDNNLIEIARRLERAYNDDEPTAAIRRELLGAMEHLA